MGSEQWREARDVGFLLRQYPSNAADQDRSRAAIHFEPKTCVQALDCSAVRPQTGGFCLPSVRISKTVARHRKHLPDHLRDDERRAEKADIFRSTRWRAALSGQRVVTPSAFRRRGSFRYADFDPKKFHFPPMWDPSEPIRLSLLSGRWKGSIPKTRRSSNLRRFNQQIRRAALLRLGHLPDDQPVTRSAVLARSRATFRASVSPMGRRGEQPAETHYFQETNTAAQTRKQLAQLTSKTRDAATITTSGIVVRVSAHPRSRKSSPKARSTSLAAREHRQWVFGEEPYRSEARAKVLRSIRRARVAAPRDDGGSGQPMLKSRARPARRTLQEARVAIQDGLRRFSARRSSSNREEKAMRSHQSEIASRLSYFLWSSDAVMPALLAV